MKNINKLFFSLVLFLFVNFYLLLYPTVNSFAGNFEDNKHEWGLYLGTKVYEERHPVDNSFFMSQSGYMLGAITNRESYNNDLYLGFKSRLGAGYVDYTSNGTGTMEDVPDYQFEGTGYVGKSFEGQTFRTTPFTGLGFRYLKNASGQKLSSTGHSGYDRESRYMYMPLGINFETGTKNNTHWEFRGEYLLFLYGQQTSYLGELGYTDFTNDQEDGSGIKLTAKYYFDKKFGVEGYMDYWDIADSKLDVSGNFMEPRNTTSETGIRFFWSF